jgi:hypothetical protein
MSAPRIYGLLAEFDSPEKLRAAATRAREAGYREMEAYTPFPVEGLAETLGHRKTRVPLLVLLGGVAGGVSGYALQYWINCVDFPINVAGRPFHSWPSFIPVTFELTILLAALAAVFGMLLLNRLPQPYHPLFNAPEFARASQDGFFLALQANDAKFEREASAKFLENLGASGVTEVAE